MKARLVTMCLVVAAVMAVSVLCAVPLLHAESANSNAQASHLTSSVIYPRDAVVFGGNYRDWSAAWQQWANSMPATDHPLFDTAACSRGQSGPVWFLGGRFCSNNDPNCPSRPAERDCTVPAGKALYFPVLNTACLSVEAVHGLCGPAGPYVDQIRAFLADTIDQTVDLHVFLDGNEIPGVKDFRVQSNLFTVALPQNNLLQAIGEPMITAGTYWGVDDGIYVMLKPLNAGQHTLRFHGTFPQFNFTLDFTYNLTVQ